MSHLTCFHKLLKKLVCQGLVFPGPAGQTVLLLKDLLKTDLSLTSLLASSDSLLLHICSCFHSSWYWNGPQTQLLCCLLYNIQPHWIFHEEGDAISSEGRGQRSLTYLAAFCPLVSATLSTLCPPSLTPYPPIYLWPPCTGRLSRVTPSPSLVWLLLSASWQTCQEGLHFQGSLNFLSPFISIYLVHSFQESTWAGAPTGHFLDEGFSSLRSKLLLAFFTIRK